jgi:hypothetical protein
MQPAGNDLYGFYVIVTCTTSSMLPPVHMLVLIVFHLFLVFQREVSSTQEPMDLKISRFQEDLSSFIMDQVVSSKGGHHLL